MTTLLALLSLAGCGGNLASVSGTVTLDDKPLETGTVTFRPVAGGPAGYGEIRSGSYRVKTGTDSGLAPGEYQVSVMATGPAPPATPQNPEPIPPSLIPDKYASPQTSGLKFTVSPSGGTFNIELKSQ